MQQHTKSPLKTHDHEGQRKETHCKHVVGFSGFYFLLLFFLIFKLHPLLLFIIIIIIFFSFKLDIIFSHHHHISFFFFQNRFVFFWVEFWCQISCFNSDLFIEDNLGLLRREDIYFSKISLLQ